MPLNAGWINDYYDTHGQNSVDGSYAQASSLRQFRPVTKCYSEEHDKNPVTCDWSDKTNQPLLPKDKMGFTPTRYIPRELDDSSLVALENPVLNPPFNNWTVNQPSPPHDSGLKGVEDLSLRDLTIDGINGYDLVQTDL